MRRRLLPILVLAGPLLSMTAAAEPAPPGGGRPAPPTAWCLTTAGGLGEAGNELPTAGGERLAQATAVAVPERVAGGAVLVDGDLLVGKVASLQAGTAVMASGAFGMLTLPPEQLAALLVTPAPAAVPLRLPPAFLGAVLTNGERIAGQPAFLNATQAGIDNGKRMVQIPRERVAAVVLRAVAPVSKPVVRLRLASGDLVSGVLAAGGDGQWNLRHALGTWAIPRTVVGSWWTESEQRLPLSSLLPVVAYDDGLDPPLLPLQRDQAADGSWLRLGAVRADRGLAARVGTSATYALAGSWRALIGAVGIVRGSPAVVRVLNDQQLLWESQPLSVNAPPQPLSVPLAGVATLRVQVVAREAQALPALAVFGWAFLVR